MQRTLSPFVLSRKAIAKTSAAVSVRRLSHVYGDGPTAKRVLFDIDLTIGQGEIVILMGPSGCGKTTILTLIGALRSVQSGSIRMLGTELFGADHATQIVVRRRIGFIFQANNLHESMTAFENVRMGLEVQGPQALRDATERCSAMLAAVGLADKIHAYPAKLSGGQKQRVAIARALVGRPALVLADEPTAALDKGTGRQIVDLLQDLAKKQGSAILMVTHDNRILDIADRILEMEDGRIIRTGKGGLSTP
ncbi:MAG: ABC transporter [Hyphomicrobium sp.]|nr:ABC transporter [Hyphomicrobium sp.]